MTYEEALRFVDRLRDYLRWEVDHAPDETKADEVLPLLRDCEALQHSLQEGLVQSEPGLDRHIVRGYGGPIPAPDWHRAFVGRADDVNTNQPAELSPQDEQLQYQLRLGSEDNR